MNDFDFGTGLSNFITLVCLSIYLSLPSSFPLFLYLRSMLVQNPQKTPLGGCWENSTNFVFNTFFSFSSSYLSHSLFVHVIFFAISFIMYFFSFCIFHCDVLWLVGLACMFFIIVDWSQFFFFFFEFFNICLATCFIHSIYVNVRVIWTLCWFELWHGL